MLIVPCPATLNRSNVPSSISLMTSTQALVAAVRLPPNRCLLQAMQGQLPQPLLRGQLLQPPPSWCPTRKTKRRKAWRRKGNTFFISFCWSVFFWLSPLAYPVSYPSSNPPSLLWCPNMDAVEDIVEDSTKNLANVEANVFSPNNASSNFSQLDWTGNISNSLWQWVSHFNFMLCEDVDASSSGLRDFSWSSAFSLYSVKRSRCLSRRNRQVVWYFFCFLFSRDSFILHCLFGNVS